jgi:hypothetical protein
MICLHLYGGTVKVSLDPFLPFFMLGHSELAIGWRRAKYNSNEGGGKKY